MICGWAAPILLLWKPVGDPKIETQHSTFKNTPPIIWTIAGSDSGGGAGIQADLKVMNAFGIHGCSVITAITAQNTMGVNAAEPVSPDLFNAQLDALKNDLPPVALKSGMLGSAETCEIFADFLQSITTTDTPRLPFICDPVLKSTSGSTLLAPDALRLLKEKIVPYVTVLTPNLPETAFLLGEELPTEQAARKLLELGPASVLIKGGHAEGGECRDFWTDGTRARWLSSPRIQTRDTHGTGCILASAIASAMAQGQTIPDAVITAKTFLNQCLKSPSNLGSGQGPMMIRPFENRNEDQPDVC